VRKRIALERGKRIGIGLAKQQQQDQQSRDSTAYPTSFGDISMGQSSHLLLERVRDGHRTRAAALPGAGDLAMQLDGLESLLEVDEVDEEAEGADESGGGTRRTATANQTSRGPRATGTGTILEDGLSTRRGLQGPPGGTARGGPRQGSDSSRGRKVAKLPGDQPRPSIASRAMRTTAASPNAGPRMLDSDAAIARARKLVSRESAALESGAAPAPAPAAPAASLPSLAIPAAADERASTLLDSARFLLKAANDVISGVVGGGDTQQGTAPDAPPTAEATTALDISAIQASLEEPGPEASANYSA